MEAIKKSDGEGEEAGASSAGAGGPSVYNEHLILRNDPYDCYKPNSDDAVYSIATLPISEKLDEEELGMLRLVAADLDRKLLTDDIEGFPMPNKYISEESRVQLERLPTWLRSMIESRWEIIHTHYGHGVHNFLMVIANRIDSQYRTQYLKIIGEAVNEEDAETETQLSTGFQLMEEDMLDEEPEAPEHIKKQAGFVIARFVGRFKAHHYTRKYWEPHMIKRAESCLRTAMITKAAAADVAVIAEEDNITDLGRVKQDLDSDNEDDSNVKHWDKYEIEDRDELRKQAKEAIEFEYHLKSADHLTQEEKKLLKVKKKMVQIERKKKKVSCWSYVRKHPLFVSNSRRKERKNILLERALYRRYSRIWYKGCGEPIQHSKKSGHQFRTDERFHCYVVSLVTWSVFKSFIMVIITANAILLAVETQHPDDWESIYDILDIFFLSLYTVEFLLKIYSHPYKYWKSGYNVFDFIILLISLTKKTVDWIGYNQLGFLKILQIFRALRVLRGVSLSVQMQVLVTALAETIKTHVLSVILLLILLLYISSIIAYYFFGKIEALSHDWGKVDYGMFKMFTFVTMDGWTDIIDHFEHVPDMFHYGRLFGVVSIVLANFLFSNIFVAIIIMNISEATDAYREKQIEDREEIVSRKKDIVFRRQKLDMRQLLARQKMSISADFFHMGSQFQRLLRHDDLVAMQEVCTSPLWMDCLYKTVNRCHITSNILMNLYRELADALLDGFDYHATSRYEVEPIRRGRYNRYMLVKAKLALIKKEIYRHHHPERKPPIQIRLPLDSDEEAHQRRELEDAIDIWGAPKIK